MGGGAKKNIFGCLQLLRHSIYNGVLSGFHFSALVYTKCFLWLQTDVRYNCRESTIDRPSLLVQHKLRNHKLPVIQAKQMQQTELVCTVNSTQ